MSNEIAVRVENLGKCYQVYSEPKDRLKQAFWRNRKQFFHAFWALNNISFEVKKGEAIGIIGRNGSGKSTLLQLLCKTLTPTQGNIEINGRVGALLELGAGFNPEFTGRENIYVNGAILGFSRKEISARLDEIIAFADIGEFIDQQVKTYSSGMFVRLAFAVQVCAEPEILIVDEALAVGDIFFQQKCFARLREIINKGTTCFFVSHDTSAVLNICDRVLYLKQGELVFDGDAKEGISKYVAEFGTRKEPTPAEDLLAAEITSSKDKLDIQSIKDTNILMHAGKRHGAQGLEIIAANVCNGQGQYVSETTMEGVLHFNLLLQANQPIHDPSAGIHLYDRFNNLVFAAGTRQLRNRLPDLNPGDELAVTLSITFNMQPGEYTFSLGVAEQSAEGANVGFLHDRHEMLGPIIVTADQNSLFSFYGIAKMPMEVSVFKINNLDTQRIFNYD